MPSARVIAGVVLVAAAGVVGSVVALRRHPTLPPTPTTKPVAASQPASKPSRAKPKKPAFASYLDAVRAGNPTVAATQPLGVPVDLHDAAHVVLREPVYVDPAGNLWVTRRDGQPLAQLLSKLPEGNEFVLRERPVFVHWFPDDGGNWTAAVVVPADPPTAGFDLVTAVYGRRHLAGPRPFRWESGYSVPALGKFVVPTDVGVSLFDVNPAPVERYHALPGCAAGATNPPATTLDSRGLLAWAPWEGGKPGSAGVSRFVDNGWTDLPAAAWPEKPIHLSVLLDNSVLRIGAGAPPTDASNGPAIQTLDLDAPTTAPAKATPAPAGPADGVTLSIAQLDATTIDTPHVEALVAQLSDPDPDKRQAAFAELSRYGPALWPVLDRVAGEQPPEGQVRIRQLLRGKLTPALGGLIVNDDRLTVARRQADGTLILFAPAGVQVPTDRENEPQTINPAWVAVHTDGRVDRPLPTALVGDQRAETCALRTAGDEWLVVDDAGPRRFFGNALVPMLPDGERRFSQFVALAGRHRWVFRDPQTGDTLVVDPTIADPTPRLPTWVIDAGVGAAVGWDGHDNPVVRHGAMPDGAGGAPPAPDETRGGFALTADGWSPLAATDTVHVDGPPPPATAPTSGPSTGPAPLLRTADGTTYADGRTAIEVVDRAGHSVRWPLPPSAVGTVDPVLMRTEDGLLFLYNAPGRLLRIRPTPAGDEPFKLEATFTADIPNDDRPARVWLDPSGRIDFATDRRLTVTFPAGRVPKAIAEMMPGDHRP